MERRTFLPSLHVRGTYYQVGYDVGKTFKDMIQEYVELAGYLKEDLVTAYNTPRGQQIYQETLDLMQNKFPHYVRELQGISDGSQVPFHLLMLLHIGFPIVERGPPKELAGTGCSSIMCNQQDIVLGHTEDAHPAADNHSYIVHADITESDGDIVRHEKFSAFCYAGHLPGYCMSVNQHGLVFSMNIVSSAVVCPTKTPRYFLTRALLTARNLKEAQDILQDVGTGAAEGFCVNMAFLKEEGPLLFHSVEVSPAVNDESQLSHLIVKPGESHARCNKFLRLDFDPGANNRDVISSDARNEVFQRIGLPHTINDVAALLSNHDNPDYSIYRDGTSTKDSPVTIATGLFDLKRKQWRLYVQQSDRTDPIAIFPLEL